MNYPKTLVIIPAFNEEESIAHVIELIHQHAPWADVAVINDGSADRTAAIAQDCGAIVLSEPYNVGIGAAVQTGFIYGLMTTGDPQRAVDYGAAHGALAMTTPGDTSMTSKEEVEKLMKGGGARVQR